MTSEFNRIVSGYSVSFNATAAALVSSANSMVVGGINGPGEILGFDISQMDGLLSDFVNDICMRLEIDGVVVCNDYLYFFVMGYIGYNFHSLFATCDIMGGLLCNVHLRYLIPFESTWQLTLFSANVTGNLVYANVLFREGA